MAVLVSPGMSECGEIAVNNKSCDSSCGRDPPRNPGTPLGGLEEGRRPYRSVRTAATARLRSIASATCACPTGTELTSRHAPRVAGDRTGQIHSRCRLPAQACTRHLVMRPRRIQRWRGNLGVALPETARAVRAGWGGWSRCVCVPPAHQEQWAHRLGARPWRRGRARPASSGGTSVRASSWNVWRSAQPGRVA
jgi:hypothetical protein